jgi:quercetin dioxygenase-like cupin family protein
VKKMSVLFTGTAVALAMAAAAAQQAAPNTTFKRTILVQGDLSAPGREVVQALAEIQPGGASGKHTHPGEEIAHVIAGTLIVESPGKPARTLQAGESMVIPAGTVHDAINRGNVLTKVLATYVIEKGKPVATTVP